MVPRVSASIERKAETLSEVYLVTGQRSNQVSLKPQLARKQKQQEKFPQEKLFLSNLWCINRFNILSDTNMKRTKVLTCIFLVFRSFRGTTTRWPRFKLFFPNRLWLDTSASAP